ncbi:MAG TPA: carboxypeptidase regulatory-like domain-containing protein, partial [Pyrinomonadaceae bacterium]
MKKLSIALVLALLSAMATMAQSNTGRLTGTVSGPDGVLPGATVTLTDTKTGKARVTTSNGEGNYNFQLLDYGEYTLKITATGFKALQSTVTINIAQEYSFSPTLEVGQVNETVTVTGGADLVNSTNAELSSTINNRQITELPLAARNPLTLILTQAGSAANPSQNTSINGGRTSSTNITRDGVNINDNFIRTNATDFASARTSVDNVEEFTLSSQSAVDSGFGSAQIAFVTPRGSNTIHGAVWEYNRNSKFGANSWFNNAAGNFGPNDSLVLSGAKKAGDAKSPRPFRNRNQYGFKIAGPLWKNKIFAFAYGEKLHDIVTSSKLVTVLTPTARQGILRYTFTDPVTKVTNTFSTSIFTPGVFIPGNSGNAVPTAINSLVSSQILGALPQGNSTETGDLLNTMGYRFSQHNDTVRKSFTSRVD